MGGNIVSPPLHRGTDERIHQRQRSCRASGISAAGNPHSRIPGLRENRGAQIRTGGLSDPNGARYQAAPHPERGKGTGSEKQVATARQRALRGPPEPQYAQSVMEALERRAS